jgi:response regulator RpfG family c-di-GMP phosphodiesterase
MSTPQRILCVDDEENILRSLKRLLMTVRIALSGYADSAAMVSAIKEGQIYKFIPKPWNDELRLTIADALDRYELKEQNVRLTQELAKRKTPLRQYDASPAAVRVVGLSRDGRWVLYYSENAKRLSSRERRRPMAAEKADFFDEGTNAVIDKIAAVGSESETVMIDERRLTAQGPAFGIGTMKRASSSRFVRTKMLQRALKLRCETQKSVFF